MGATNDGVIFFKLSTGAQTPAEINATIASIDAIIASLLTTALSTVTDGGVAEYEIDTGQTKQSVKYRSMAEINKSLKDYRMLRKMYQSDLLPRSFRLMDYKNIQR